MAYTVLARRYRSSTFDEIVGQEHIAQTLKKAIETGRIAHAYLFCGTRGTGKTSMARILAKALNCHKFDAATATPCGQCDSCIAVARGDDLDVIEIDAASNTGVDNVREIIENSQYRPARSRFKVYIIDEVHMLSKSAFNALLKTLEEPPSHVKFILATTEPEKVPATILSRCQRYDFRNIPSREIAAHLKEICKKEKIKADDEALALVAKAGAGSMRDALSLLDRLLSIGEKHLTVEQIEHLLGSPRAQLVFDLAQAIGEADVKKTLTQAESMISGGLSPDAMLAALLDQFRNLLIIKTCGQDSGLLDIPGMSLSDLTAQAERFDPITLSQSIAIIEQLRRQIRQSQTGRALLDATLVRLALAEQFTSISQLLTNEPPAQAAPSSQKKKPEPVTTAPALAPVEDSAADDDDDLPRPGKVWENSGPSLAELMKQQAASMAAPPKTPVVDPPPPSVANLDDGDIVKLWPLLLAKLRQDQSMLEAPLSMARLVAIDNGQAVIRFSTEGATFAKLFSSNGKKESLAKALTELRGQPLGVRFEIDEEAPPPAKPAAPAPAPVRRPVEAKIEAPVASTRPTPELIQQAQADPLVQAVLREFGGTIIKVE